MDATPQRAPRPLGLLAELTHRCPLGCPYCSNPLALEPRADELDTASWARVFKEAAALGVLQVHLSGGEPAARRDLVELTRAAHDAGLYTNLITSAVGITKETFGKLSDAGLDHVQISIQDNEPGTRRSHRRLQRRVCAQAGARRRSHAARHSADRQRRDAPRQYRSRRGDGGACARARRQARRDRACAVLRLGAEEPRAADADARTGRSRGDDGRNAPQAASRPDRDRRRGAGLLRALPESLRRRLGAALAQRHAVRQGAALSRGGKHSRPDVLECARAFARRHLGQFAGVSWRFAAPTGCRSRAAHARSGKKTSAAAAVRPSRSPATPARPIRCAISRRIMRWSANSPRRARTRHTSIGARFSACSRATPRCGKSRLARAVSGRQRARS